MGDAGPTGASRAVLALGTLLILCRGAPSASRADVPPTEKDLGSVRAELQAGQIDGDVERQARALHELGQAQFDADEYSSAAESFDAAARLHRTLGEWSSAADSLHRAGMSRFRLGENEVALGALDASLDLHRGLDEPAAEASVRNAYCLALQRLGRFHEAASCYETTLATARELGDRTLEGQLLNNLGGIYANLGEPEEQFESLRAALDLRRELGDEFAIAATLNNLGSLHRSFGEVDEAIHHLTEALTIFEALDNRYWMARTLNNLGYAYLDVGEPERARAYLLRAIPIRREVGDRAGEAVTLRNLGRTFEALEDDGKALAFYRKALDAAASRDDARGMVTGRKLLGGYLAERRPEEARQELELALADAREMGHRHEQAEILELLGRAHLASGVDGLQSARDAAQESLDLHRAVRDPLGQAAALTLLARVERRRSAHAAAQTHLDEALAALDSVDRRLGEASRRSAFLASQRKVYELYVDVLMARHRDEPSAGFGGRALAISEAARSRALVAMLDRAPETSGVPSRDTALQSAERRLAAKIQREIDLLGVEPSAEEARRAQSERLEALAAVESARAARRREGGRRSGMSPEASDMAKLDAAGIQRLADDGTVILEVLLGDERSHGWWIEGKEIVPLELPARDEVERLARSAYEGLSSLGSQAAREALDALGDMLLGPFRDRLGTQRLAWVPDGALHLVPFAALGDPRSPPGVYEPLLLRHEVVSLPSVTALAEQRAATHRQVATGGTLAILADPIFSQSDPRLVAEASDATRGDDLARLELSRVEAEAIAALVDEPARLLALAQDARRDLVVDGSLNSYRILHFATHGIVHPNTPELSGLVLSRFDGKGSGIDSFLGLHDVARLDLAAELVVLSGCHTALGKQVQGEGLVGLARGFMYAGAPRVLASHWQVRDQATSELMTTFYRSLLVDGLAAASAIRAAQLKLRSNRKYRDPYYWAAFSLQGDWR